jgi:hypothetical protein
MVTFGKPNAVAGTSTLDDSAKVKVPTPVPLLSTDGKGAGFIDAEESATDCALPEIIILKKIIIKLNFFIILVLN